MLTIELRFLITELVYCFKGHSGLSTAFDYQGTYEVLQAIQRMCVHFVHPSKVSQLQTCIGRLLQLDRAIEHGIYGAINQQYWDQSVNDIKQVATLCSFNSLIITCNELINLTTVRHQPGPIDRFFTILLHSRLIYTTSEQRQILITLLINLAGIELRYRGRGPQFQQGDKEAFKALLDTNVRRALFRFSSSSSNYSLELVKELIALRNSKRHNVYINSLVSRSAFRKEVTTLLEVAQNLNAHDLSGIYDLALQMIN